MIKSLSWEAFSHHDRHIVIGQIKSIINDNGGAIMNFNMFSDLALAISIEIEENMIKTLYQCLRNSINISDLEHISFSLTSKKEWLIFLNISFAHGKGDIKQEVPSVPG